jgi:N-acetyl-alpha-D-glucosaminyl L-malate synthase BshA
MAQVAQIENLDIIHVHYAIPHSISAILAKQMVNGKVKVVTTLHGTDITVLGNDENLANLIRFGIEQSDAVTAVSDSLIKETRELLDITKPIDRIYNFIDRQVFRQSEVVQLKKELIPHGEKVLLHISNFRKVKRVEDVIHIFNIVNQQIPSKLVLIGEGPEMPYIRKLICDYGLDKQVLFLGKRDDVAEVLSLADCVLLPSEKESFGLVALEAMACGVPVVASNAGGIPEVIVHGETGYLAEVGNYTKMAEYVLELLLHEEKWIEFSNNSLQRAYNNFSCEKIVVEYEEIYRRLIS